jgi:hypothetical protein
MASRNKHTELPIYTRKRSPRLEDFGRLKVKTCIMMDVLVVPR